MPSNIFNKKLPRKINNFVSYFEFLTPLIAGVIVVIFLFFLFNLFRFVSGEPRASSFQKDCGDYKIISYYIGDSQRYYKSKDGLNIEESDIKKKNLKEYVDFDSCLNNRMFVNISNCGPEVFYFADYQGKSQYYSNQDKSDKVTTTNFLRCIKNNGGIINLVKDQNHNLKESEFLVVSEFKNKPDPKNNYNEYFGSLYYDQNTDEYYYEKDKTN
jgi:hypothetical protein